MSVRLNVPNDLKVGFQERKDTYSGLLAYVTYLREDAPEGIAKFKSWNNWRDNKISPKDFKNKPTSGFVINKNVGGYQLDHFYRNAYCRIWDPRGFEIEISIPNLLYIINNCGISKGGALEGEFVYSWNGTELFLLPVCSEDYKFSISEAKKETKLTSKDMTIGSSYIDKNGNEVIYIGHFPIIDVKDKEVSTGTFEYTYKSDKKYMFLCAYKTWFVPSEERKFIVKSDLLKNLRYKIEDGKKSLAECKELENHILNSVWYGNSTYKLGDFNFVIPDDYVKPTDKSEFNKKEYFAYKKDENTIFFGKLYINRCPRKSLDDSRDIVQIQHYVEIEKLAPNKFRTTDYDWGHCDPCDPIHIFNRYGLTIDYLLTLDNFYLSSNDLDNFSANKIYIENQFGLKIDLLLWKEHDFIIHK